jgi:small subunit ribosomal protein S10
MPTLRRYVNHPGYYVVSAINNLPVTFQLTKAGEDRLTRTLRLTDHAHFDVAELISLVEQGWAYTHRSGPGALLPLLKKIDKDAPRPPIEVTHKARLNSYVLLRFESTDAGTLDAIVGTLIQLLAKEQVSMMGPVPLPTRVERYRVLSTRGSKEYCVHTHKRILTLINPEASAMQAAAALSVPPGVEIKVRERALAESL